MSRITRFETVAERLVEGTFARLFAGPLQAHEVSLHLARAMEDNQMISPEGIHQAPTHYQVYLHPDAAAALAAERPALEQELATVISELAAQANLVLPFSPTVQMLPGSGLEPHQVRIEARMLSGGLAPSTRPRAWAHCRGAASRLRVRCRDDRS